MLWEISLKKGHRWFVFMMLYLNSHFSGLLYHLSLASTFRALTKSLPWLLFNWISLFPSALSSHVFSGYIFPCSSHTINTGVSLSSLLLTLYYTLINRISSPKHPCLSPVYFKVIANKINNNKKIVVIKCAQLLSHIQLFMTPWTHKESSGLLCPWDCPGKNTGLCCHFLLQVIKWIISIIKFIH